MKVYIIIYRANPTKQVCELRCSQADLVRTLELLFDDGDELISVIAI